MRTGSATRETGRDGARAVRVKGDGVPAVAHPGVAHRAPGLRVAHPLHDPPPQHVVAVARELDLLGYVPPAEYKEQYHPCPSRPLGLGTQLTESPGNPGAIQPASPPAPRIPDASSLAAIHWASTPKLATQRSR